jgi:tRNA wybutosine-synthesizing protein 3
MIENSEKRTSQKWLEYRRRKLEEYLNSREKGEIDRDILNLLDAINYHPQYVTLSSCSGRIAVLDIPEFGKKSEAEFLGKWHHEVEPDSIINAALMCSHTAWLIQYPPILHVACSDLEAASILLRIANNSGFRRSGIISPKNFVVEIASLERMELPIAEKGNLLVDLSYLDFVVELSNRKLREGKAKLKRFERKMEAIFKTI